VERAHSSNRDSLFKFFTFKNTYRYIDVVPKFIKDYNNTVHSTTGMKPSRLTHADVLAIWLVIEAKIQGVRDATAKIRVGQRVGIIKEKMNFAKAAERNFTTEIFRFFKVIHRRPRAVYELEDKLAGRWIISFTKSN